MHKMTTKTQIWYRRYEMYRETYTNKRIQVFNNNNASIHWSKSTTIKGLRHVLIQENTISELVVDKTVSI